MEYASFHYFFVDNSKSLYITAQGRHNGYKHLYKLLLFSKKNCIQELKLGITVMDVCTNTYYKRDKFVLQN